MRIAVLADIHGNLRALEAVLADLPRRGADLVVSLGDCLSGPLQPAGVADRLMALGWPTLRGNHDRQLLDRPVEAMTFSDAFSAGRITASHRRWLAALPPVLQPVEGVLACHGTPADDLTYALEVVAGPQHLRPATALEAAARIGPTPGAGLILCGHSHLARMVRLPDGRLVVNPGSVGQPGYRDTDPHPHVVFAGTPHARYALVERGPAGWGADFLAIPYDWDAAAADARAAGRADWAQALATGQLDPP
ncbi:metallophosphoesterase family protein [Belnapia rosea]|uniref:metallophosphoesterase family protein n=1 Tax=Belnapia rosea TaxID=938405 RepID=UPI00088C2735|nr:metallophosphoesterase family protein [Belnapia rosea]SDB63725.1 Predicted phosphodiesterase [Belnapia rosea]